MADDDHDCVYREIVKAIFGFDGHDSCYIEQRDDRFIIDGWTDNMSPMAIAAIDRIREAAYREWSVTPEGINGRAASAYLEHRASLSGERLPHWRDLPEVQREFWRNVVQTSDPDKGIS